MQGFHLPLRRSFEEKSGLSIFLKKIIGCGFLFYFSVSVVQNFLSFFLLAHAKPM